MGMYFLGRMLLRFLPVMCFEIPQLFAADDGEGEVAGGEVHGGEEARNAGRQACPRLVRVDAEGARF